MNGRIARYPKPSSQRGESAEARTAPTSHEGLDCGDKVRLRGRVKSTTDTNRECEWRNNAGVIVSPEHHIPSGDHKTGWPCEIWQI